MQIQRAMVHRRRSALLALGFSCFAWGCVGDKGEESPLPVDGAADSWRRPTEHGVVAFGEPMPAELSEGSLYHAWRFVLSGDAQLGLRVSPGTEGLDTVLYLYRRELGATAWGSYVARNDDFEGNDWSGLDVALGPGEYRVLVKGYDESQRGAFTLTVDCAGGGCGVADGTCFGRCGEPSTPGECACDADCASRGDCCGDETLACEYRADDIDASWLAVLDEEFARESFAQLLAFLEQEYAAGPVYPPQDQVFNALIHAPLEDVRVVILGQDPYFNPGQAHGFSFSVQDGVPIPPSLRNIFKEVAEDTMGIDPSSAAFQYPPSGNLIPWADQGVLLLNTILTVRDGEPGSHGDRGWEVLTDRIISLISEREENVVFLLWGANAQAKASLIDQSRHLVLAAAHPSPLATGFRGCRHFSQANQYLEQHGAEPIDWYGSIW